MTHRLTIRVDPSAVSMARAIRVAAAGTPLLVLTGRAFADLSRELGSMEAGTAYLLEVAESVGRPIGIYFETAADRSTTAFISPPGWSQERLSGRVAAKHQELESEFGPVTRLGPNRAERRRRRRGAG